MRFDITHETKRVERLTTKFRDIQKEVQCAEEGKKASIQQLKTLLKSAHDTRTEAITEH